MAIFSGVHHGKSGWVSQITRITRKTGAETVSKKVDSTDIRRKVIADDAHYHAEKLGLGGHGTHEGWIKAEESRSAAKAAVTAEIRQKMIAVAAYYLAEKRGFVGHGADEDWMKAEAEIDAMLHDRSGKS
jgi:hypothetical protein